MSQEFDPSTIEAKWQKKWDEAKIYETDLKKAKNPFYSLVMFPYPSGDKLHVGHWYNFAPADSFARYMRMKGNDVMEPMGFDAFGLPAENYAIKSGIPPEKSTSSNVQTMVKQLKRMGCMYDWSKMVNTSSPEYYRWTQWLFLKMYEHKLAYKKEASVNFCSKCQTVLANEQAQDGTCERCGTEVAQKSLAQWFWKITDYAERLLQGLDDLDWPEKTKLMQRNWIGRSEGAEITFDLVGHTEKLTVFTTRPDTLFGATYMVLAPEHPLVEKITPKDHKGVVQAYREQVAKKTEMERTDLAKVKTGEPTGAFAVNPATGEQIPIWIADYVLMTYGTGAIMAVPAHDERDFDFATSHQLDVKCVVDPDIQTPHFSTYIYQNPALAKTSGQSLDKGENIEWNTQCRQNVLEGTRCWTGPGKAISSDFLNSMGVEEAKKRMIAWLEDEGRGRARTTFRLRDWLVSRQRYWGAPIPIVYDPEGNPHPIPEKHLPWLLPTDVAFKPTGKSPLTESKEFIERTEKIFGKGWMPEFDTMDTFVCSSFYYLMYLSSDGFGMQAPPFSGSKEQEKQEKNHPIDPHVERTWMPVSMYIGGPEHACMHLIYARFVMMALKDFGFVSHEEPFKKLVHQGLITNNGAKMSKSKGNVVSPDSFIERHGSDVFRMYLMFMGPFTEGGDWSDTGIKGIDRFVKRIYALCTDKVNKKVDQPNVLAALHRTIKKVTEDIEALKFNTAISALMEFLNLAEEEGGVTQKTAQTLTLLLAPIAPHLAEELWGSLKGPSFAKATEGKKGFVIEQKWPSFDPKLTKESTLMIAIQVNGKVRGEIEVAADASKDDVLLKAKAHPNVQKFLEGKKLKKEIYVKGRLVSLVV
ncbi:leucine--tRNA ligase [Candidatus Peregrinibacteria bacterium CG1_02_54_53]|nr:MAG: leucine--tRNA ligase [Candidatus Peregrinibacteria bacterium CG1_02_54_53]